MRQNNLWIPGQGLFIGGHPLQNLADSNFPVYNYSLPMSENNQDNNQEDSYQMTSKCGYPYKFFKVQSEYLNALRCTSNPENIISLKSVQDHDGNLHCLECYNNLKKRKPGIYIEPQQAPYKLMVTLAKSIVVCLHKEEGCQFEGMYSEIEEHLKNQCNFEMIECQDCHQFMTRPALVDHAGNCEFRKIKCKYCGEELLFSNQKIHEENECQQIPITCYCGKTIPKSELDSHKEECELYFCKACNITVKKTELNQHYANDLVKHLSMFGDVVSEIEQLNTELQEEKALRKKIKQLINCKVGNLEFGSQCNICFRKIEQFQPQFYCHTCHLWFCEECANQEKLNKQGSEKLSHSHNLVYINVINTAKLGSIEPFKFGHNIYFKNDYNEIQKSQCSICEQQSQYQKNRWLCLNCPVRPAQNKAGYKCFEMCDQCMETLKKRDTQDEEYKLLYERNKKKTNNQHDLDSHVYLRLRISHFYPEFY